MFCKEKLVNWIFITWVQQRPAEHMSSSWERLHTVVQLPTFQVACEKNCSQNPDTCRNNANLLHAMQREVDCTFFLSLVQKDFLLDNKYISSQTNEKSDSFKNKSYFLSLLNILKLKQNLNCRFKKTTNVLNFVENNRG